MTGGSEHAISDPVTIPRLLIAHASVRGRRASIREKDLGIWQTWTWSDVLAEVQALAAGLSLLGLARGDHLAIVGDNRPRLYWSMTAAQALGAIPVPLYQDAITSEMQFVLEDAEVGIAFAEDQEQVDKLLEVRATCPQLARIWYDDARGLRHYQEPGLASLDSLVATGRAFAAADPGFFAREVALAFRYDWVLADGTPAPFDVVDLITLTADRSRIARLVICYDSAPLRAAWERARI